MSCDSIEITIKNWDKYRSKSERIRYPHSLRIRNNLPQSQAIWGLTPEERWVFICLLCLASQQNSKTFSLNLSWFSNWIGGSTPVQVVETAIQKLEAAEMLSINREFSVSKMSKKREFSVSKMTEKCQSTVHPTVRSTVRQTKDPTNIEVCSEPVFETNDAVVIEVLKNAQIKPEAYVLWRATYGENGFVDTELKKAVCWLDANRHKAPKKNFQRFFSNWLSRGWEIHRKNLPSRKGWEPDTRIMTDEDFKEALNSNWGEDKVLREK